MKDKTPFSPSNYCKTVSLLCEVCRSRMNLATVSGRPQITPADIRHCLHLIIMLADFTEVQKQFREIDQERSKSKINPGKENIHSVPKELRKEASGLTLSGLGKETHKWLSLSATGSGTGGKHGFAVGMWSHGIKALPPNRLSLGRTCQTSQGEPDSGNSRTCHFVWSHNCVNYFQIGDNLKSIYPSEILI